MYVSSSSSSSSLLSSTTFSSRYLGPLQFLLGYLLVLIFSRGSISMHSGLILWSTTSLFLSLIEPIGLYSISALLTIISSSTGTFNRLKSSLPSFTVLKLLVTFTHLYFLKSIITFWKKNLLFISIENTTDTRSMIATLNRESFLLQNPIFLHSHLHWKYIFISDAQESHWLIDWILKEYQPG